jgi:hypothetical protein
MTKRREPPRLTVCEYSAFLTLGCQYPPFEMAWRQVTLDQAHVLIEAPYVVVTANQGARRQWTGSPEMIETGWLVIALGLIEDDAMNAFDDATEALRADIDTGNIAWGTHKQWIPRNPLEPPVEAELRAYRERVLRDLETEAIAR